MRRIAASVGLALLFALGCATASAQTVMVERLRVESALQHRPVLTVQSMTSERLRHQVENAPVLQRWTASSGRTRIHLPRDVGSNWLRLTVDRDVAVGERQVIAMQGARAYGAVAYLPPGSDRWLLLGLTRETGPTLFRRGWALPLPRGWKRGDAAYVIVEADIAKTLKVVVTGEAELAQQREADRRYAIGAYGAMLLMVLVVVGFWLLSREAMYLYYCGYLISASAYTLMMSGWMTVPTDWVGLEAQYTIAPWLAATMTTVFQLAFTVRFLDLPRLLPRTALLLRAIIGANLLWLAVMFLAYERVKYIWAQGGNGLLLLAIPIVLYAAIAAWRRGAEYAGYYLLGWTPLIAFAGLTAAKIHGIGNAEWAERGLLLAIVLESGVLMMALTQRAAARHRRAARAGANR